MTNIFGFLKQSRLKYKPSAIQTKAKIFKNAIQTRLPKKKTIYDKYKDPGSKYW